MAKKNLAAIMSSIIGESPATEESPTTAPEIQEPEAQHEQPRNKRVGRPPKSGQHEMSKETRATFIVSTDILWKLKYIGLVDSRLMKDVVGTAFKEYINQWERDNGPIKSPK